MSFEYQPLHVKQSTARLSLHSLELGVFHYDLSLRALPAPPEKTVHFSIPLGRSQVELVKFLNYSHVKTDYACSVSSMFLTIVSNFGVMNVFFFFFLLILSGLFAHRATGSC